ncbi:MAG: zinc-binding alcohol dehydrogenase [Lentisphaerota bacterium]
MEKNFCIVFKEPKNAILDERPIPCPADNQVLIKTRKTLVSTGTELTAFSGDYPKDSKWAEYLEYPFMPGYNNIGEIVDAGAKVDKKWIGRKVASTGGHSSYSVQSPERIYEIQRDVSDEEAVFFTIAQIVMNSVRRGQVGWGDSVIVYGLGLLGQFAVLFSRLSGARPVFAVDISDYRLGLLPQSPSIIKINSSADVFSKVEEHTRKRMADVVFEVTGNSSLIPAEFEALKRQGRFVVLSSPSGKTQFDFHDLCNSPSFTIIGTHNSSHPKYETPDNPWTLKRDFELFIDLVADREIDLRGMISHKIDYKCAPGIYKKMLEDRSKYMGVIIDWN